MRVILRTDAYKRKRTHTHVCLSVCLSVRPSVCLSVSESVSHFDELGVYCKATDQPCRCPNVCLSFSLSLSPPVCQSTQACWGLGGSPSPRESSRYSCYGHSRHAARRLANLAQCRRDRHSRPSLGNPWCGRRGRKGRTAGEWEIGRRVDGGGKQGRGKPRRGAGTTNKERTERDAFGLALSVFMGLHVVIGTCSDR